VTGRAWSGRVRCGGRPRRAPSGWGARAAAAAARGRGRRLPRAPPGRRRVPSWAWRAPTTGLFLLAAAGGVLTPWSVVSATASGPRGAGGAAGRLPTAVAGGCAVRSGGRRRGHSGPGGSPQCSGRGAPAVHDDPPSSFPVAVPCFLPRGVALTPVAGVDAGGRRAHALRHGTRCRCQTRGGPRACPGGGGGIGTYGRCGGGRADRSGGRRCSSAPSETRGPVRPDLGDRAAVAVADKVGAPVPDPRTRGASCLAGAPPQGRPGAPPCRPPAPAARVAPPRRAAAGGSRPAHPRRTDGRARRRAGASAAPPLRRGDARRAPADAHAARGASTGPAGWPASAPAVPPPPPPPPLPPPPRRPLPPSGGAGGGGVAATKEKSKRRSGCCGSRHLRLPCPGAVVAAAAAAATDRSGASTAPSFRRRRAALAGAVAPAAASTTAANPGVGADCRGRIALFPPCPTNAANGGSRAAAAAVTPPGHHVQDGAALTNAGFVSRSFVKRMCEVRVCIRLIVRKVHVFLCRDCHSQARSSAECPTVSRNNWLCLLMKSVQNGFRRLNDLAE